MHPRINKTKKKKIRQLKSRKSTIKCIHTFAVYNDREIGNTALTKSRVKDARESDDQTDQEKLDKGIEENGYNLLLALFT